jgi:hypothetical protein
LRCHDEEREGEVLFVHAPLEGAAQLGARLLIELSDLLGRHVGRKCSSIWAAAGNRPRHTATVALR